MKSIWFANISLDQMREWSRHRLIENLGIELTEVGDNFLRAIMQVDDRTLQPMGSLHGGATCLLAETVGSIAANFCIDWEKRCCVGLEINVNHMKAVKSGFIEAEARPFHLGRSTQVWDIQIRHENQLIAVSRFTVAVLQKN